MTSGPTSYVFFGFGWGQQMGEEPAAPCSSIHSGGSRLGQVLSPPVPNPQPPGTRLAKSGHGERTNSLKAGALSYKVLVSSSSWHLLLTKRTSQSNGFLKVMSSLTPWTVPPDKISGLLPGWRMAFILQGMYSSQETYRPKHQQNKTKLFLMGISRLIAETPGAWLGSWPLHCP